MFAGNELNLLGSLFECKLFVLIITVSLHNAFLKWELFPP